MKKEEKAVYKAIISDFDGTLACSDKSITKQNYEAIERLIKGGKKFALSTGRMTASALMLLDRLPFKPIISTYNGGEIIDSETGEVLLRKAIDTELLLEMISYAKERGLYFQIFDDEVIVEEINVITEIYCSICKVRPRAVGDLYQYVKEKKATSPKMMIISFNGDVDNYIKDLKIKFGDRVEVVRCQDGMIDITPKGVDKGSAVRDICKIWGISESECIGIGDEGNDVAMFKVAGLGVSMVNAREEVKAEADFVTQNDNDRSGVAEIINKFLLGDL